jgi:hypothetical protein
MGAIQGARTDQVERGADEETLTTFRKGAITWHYSPAGLLVVFVLVFYFFLSSFSWSFFVASGMY